MIGLTGGIASGKSSLSNALRQAGAVVIDADKISHELTMVDGAALPAILEAFGEGVFRHGALDRAALGNLVFSDRQQLDRLNALMYPLILAEMERQIDSSADQAVVILDVPLLYEAGWDSMCDEVWCAWAPKWMQVRRLIKRNGLTLRQALDRIKSQMPAHEKARRATHVIKTTGTRQESARKALILWRDALRRARRD
jgi:dephospho-CoA kinase